MDVSVSLTSDEEDADLVLQVDMVDDDRRDERGGVDSRWDRGSRQTDSRRHYSRREDFRDMSPRDMPPRDRSPQRYTARQEMSMGISDRYMDSQLPAASETAQLQMARQLLLEHHMRSHRKSMFPRGLEGATLVDGRPIDPRVAAQYVVGSTNTKQVVYNRPPEIREPPKKADEVGSRVEWTLTHDKGLRVVVGGAAKEEKKDEGKKEGEEGEKKEGEGEKKEEEKPEEKKEEDKEGEKKEAEKKPEAGKKAPKVPIQPVTFEAKLVGGTGSVSIVPNEPRQAQPQYNVDECSCYIDMLLGPDGCRECVEFQRQQGSLPAMDIRSSYDTRGGYDMRDTVDIRGAMDMRGADMDARGGYMDRQCRHPRGGYAMDMRGGGMDRGRGANMEMEIRCSPTDVRYPSTDMRRVSRDFRPTSMDYRSGGMDYRPGPAETTRATLEVRAPVDTRDSRDYMDLRAPVGSGTSMDFRRGMDMYERRSPVDIQALEIRAPVESRRMPSSDRRSGMELRKSLMYVRDQGN